MKKLLQTLYDEVLLGRVGKLLLENWRLFPHTIENMEDWKENAGMPLQELSRSSLVGADDELAIEEWIAEDEADIMYLLLDGVDVRRAMMQVRHPGGNTSKGALSYSITIPPLFAKSIGIKKEDREVTLSFDGDEIIIRKKKTRD